MLNISFRIKQKKQSYKIKRRQSLVFQLRQQGSYLVCAIARLIVMLGGAIFRSCRGFSTCMDTRTSDRTCLRAWTGKSLLKSLGGPDYIL